MTTPHDQLVTLLARCAQALVDEYLDDPAAQDSHDTLRALAAVDGALGTTYLSELRRRRHGDDPDVEHLG